MKALKYCAVAGAFALVGSLAWATPATADTSSKAVITNGTLDVDNDVYRVNDYVVEANISGCDAGRLMKAIFVYEGPGPVGAVSETDEFPGGAAQDVTFFAPANGDYTVYVTCTDYKGDHQVIAGSDVKVPHGFIDMRGPNDAPTWSAGDTVTLTSGDIYDLDSGAPLGLFDPGTHIEITITGPDGKSTQFLTNSTADGAFEHSMVLPYDVEGVYTVTVKGLRGRQEVLLIDHYKPVGPDDGQTPDPGKDKSKDKDKDKKPGALPKTGSESWSLVPAAALISVVAGGTAVALRSRKH